KTARQLQLRSSILHFGREVLSLFGNGNLFIGGSHALNAHGLILGSPPADLDLVLYKPTHDQLTYVQSNFVECNKAIDLAGYSHKVYRVERDGQKLDLIVESTMSLPQDPLYFNAGLGIRIPVQPIDRIIAAKLQYS